MSKKKFYAVKTRNSTKIYDNWDECRQEVEGVKGVKYKSFKTEDEANKWLSGESEELDDGKIKVYVDGSFQPSLSQYAGWGLVAIKNSRVIFEKSGLTKAPALSRNIDGELRASLEAMKWANEEKIQIVICHDYEGISKWALGLWKAKSEIAKLYVQTANKWLGKHQFEKVDAHSGNKWNDYADRLAKEAIQNFIKDDSNVE